jgi:hypothetical protein
MNEPDELSILFAFVLSFCEFGFFVAGTALKFSAHAGIIQLYIQAVNTLYEVPGGFYYL